MFTMALPNISWITALLLYAFFVLAFRLFRSGRRERGLPPGPPTIPILGNASQIPRQHAYLQMTEWARQYGGIYSLKVLWSTIIVLTDPVAVQELLEKRSVSSSDRPSLFLADRVADGLHIALMRHGRVWRRLRRFANEILSMSESNKHLPIQTAETSQLLYDILKTPEDSYRHLGRFTNSIIMSVAYGIRTPRYETKHATIFYEMEEKWTALMAPGAHPPVDLVKILRYVPERWASWKSEAREIRHLQRNLYLDLLSGAEDRLQRGEENGSFVESLLKRQDRLKLDRLLLAYLGGVLIEAGTETAASFLRTFMLMMIENPDVAHKAQQEIDDFVGETRTPSIEDAPQLPYINAIIKEVFRIRPMTPLSLPHALVSDEIYLNYHLPKGATVLLNVWGIFRDPEIFDRPDDFYPERYLLSEHGTKPGYDGLSPRSTISFGAGRRLCPGMHVANNTVLLAVMNMIWAFDFLRPLGKDGKPVALDLDHYASGLTTQPEPYDCRLVPRSQKKAALIEANFADAIKILNKFEDGLDAAERL